MYEFTRLKLTKDEFYNLIFMGSPRQWRANKEQHKFLLDICHKPLKEVVAKVIEKAGLEGWERIPVRVFDNIDVIAIGEKEPWFKRHARLSLNFNKGLMDKLWIRNLTDHERKSNPNGTFYIEDGNHRALVYAVYLELGKAVYEPVDAIHATSWDIANGILGHSCQPAQALEHDGKFQDNKNSAGDFQLPNDIQINTYKRY